MCCENPTIRKSSTRFTAATALGLALTLGLVAAPAQAQIEGVLEEITVTAQKREEALQEVPISIATLSGEQLNVLFSGSEDILALSGRVPGLYAESSNGRSAPRFYLRGLGNIDFDLAASQPVSIIMDEVVMENVVLKSFPLFDVQQIEVIRGPQGTLFGRNTTAGIIKINTNRPGHDTTGYFRGSFATYNTVNFEGAVGGSLVENKLSARVSGLVRGRNNYITNGLTGEESLGRYDELAGRVQFDWTPTDALSVLFSYQTRELEGTSSIFRANVFTTGSSSLNENYRREEVWFDGGDNNPQQYRSNGTTLNIEYNAPSVTFTSITSFQDADGSSRGDIDGGVVDFSGTTPVPPGITSDPNAPVFGGTALTFPGTITVPSVTEDGANTEQVTQEFRLASNGDGPLSWQTGLYFFDSKLDVTTENFASFGFITPGSRQDPAVRQENQAFAIFGQGSYDFTDALTMTAGVRYTDDKKDFEVLQFGQLWIDAGSEILNTAPISVSDDRFSWELSANYGLNDDSNLYARVADGFRAQTIQGRDVAFGEAPSVAEPETIFSVEGGWKATLLDDRLRLNAALFWYEVDDLQLSIIGGASNVNQVINAAKGEATGAEIDLDWLINDNFLASFGASFNNTEIKDPGLATRTCGSGLCTPTDPVDPTDASRVLLNGNPFPRAPESTYNVSLRYQTPVGTNGEFFVFTDWAFYGKINMPLYEAVEFATNNQFEGGLRVGYKNYDNGWGVAVFGRNITDEDNVLGFIDFSNNTGFVNEPTVWGFEVNYDFDGR